MGRRLNSVLGVGVVHFAAMIAAADTVVFSQTAFSSAEPTGYQFSNAVFGQSIADDVPAFASATSLKGIDWWGFTDVNQFTIRIFEEEADFADRVAWYTQTGVTATTSAGRYGGETKFSFDFGSPIMLDAGKVYWFSVEGEGASDGFQWSLASGGSNNALAYTEDIGNVNNPWTAYPDYSAAFNVAFELRSAVVVPLPGAALAGLGGLGLVAGTSALRKRRMR